jgi:hypothetical protein
MKPKQTMGRTSFKTHHTIRTNKGKGKEIKVKAQER